ncbi:unnamed protein product [Acanthoscelides obtectus]|uniref:Uncharacterized protein n=1 Tax=Acanthoscelides obtectus TaxID=200917 RepID=A0A9P0LMV0_ACAOB|nr:unnamed protein product [Acanthoscelides obtectus]CAK1651454.1 hypothetical protein AOBTE_LOCUS17289 [Acanthoscelides obtectus]
MSVLWHTKIKPKRSSQIANGKEKSKIKIIKWVDKRSIFMITTHPAHNATLVPTAKLRLNYYWAPLW